MIKLQNFKKRLTDKLHLIAALFLLVFFPTVKLYIGSYIDSYLFVRNQWKSFKLNAQSVKYEYYTIESALIFSEINGIKTSSLLGKLLKKIRWKAYESAKNKLKIDNFTLNFLKFENEINDIDLIESNAWDKYNKLEEYYEAVYTKVIKSPFMNKLIGTLLLGHISGNMSDPLLLEKLKNTDAKKFYSIIFPSCLPYINSDYIKARKLDDKLVSLLNNYLCIWANLGKHKVIYKNNNSCNTSDMFGLINQYNSLVKQIDDFNIIYKNTYKKSFVDLKAPHTQHGLKILDLKNAIIVICPNMSKELLDLTIT